MCSLYWYLRGQRPPSGASAQSVPIRTDLYRFAFLALPYPLGSGLVLDWCFRFIPSGVYPTLELLVHLSCFRNQRQTSQVWNHSDRPRTSGQGELGAFPPIGFSGPSLRGASPGIAWTWRGGCTIEFLGRLESSRRPGPHHCGGARPQGRSGFERIGSGRHQQHRPGWLPDTRPGSAARCAPASGRCRAEIGAGVSFGTVGDGALRSYDWPGPRVSGELRQFSIQHYIITIVRPKTRNSVRFRLVAN